MRYVISTTCVFVVCAMVLAGGAQAQVLFGHRDDNNPNGEGFTDFTVSHGSTSVTGPVNDGGTLAWQWDVGTDVGTWLLYRAGSACVLEYRRLDLYRQGTSPHF